MNMKPTKLLRINALKGTFTSIFLIFFSISSLLASDVLKIDEKRSEDYDLRGAQLEILEDLSNRLTLQQLLTGKYEAQFIVHDKKNKFAFVKNTKATYWIRFKIKATAPLHKHFVLENRDLHIDEFELYKPGYNGEYLKGKAGFALPFGLRDYPHKNFVFDLSLSNTEQTYYVKVRSHNHNPFILKVKSTSNFALYALNEYYLLGMFYGILAIMAIYNLLMFFSLRDKVYLYYVLYVLCSALISLGEDGMGFQYIWPNYPALNASIALIAPLLLMVSFAVYAKSFLELKRIVPMMNKILSILILFYIGFFLLDVLVLNIRLDFPLYIIPFLVIYISSFLCFKKGLRQARYFIVGYSFMFVSIVFLIFRMSGIIRWDDIFTVYSFNIGIVFEILILSFALGDRIKIIKAENEVAQDKIIEQLQVNQKLKDQVNRELEGKVQERTSELHTKHKELESAYEEINRMNQLLDEDNKVLKTNVKELTKARVLMKEVDFAEFSNIFPDKDSCLKYLEDLKWARGYKCKKCGNIKWCKGKDDFSKRCTKCRYDESPTAFTIFHKLKFPIVKAFYMLFLVYANKEKITSLELSEILTLRQSTCWNFNKKINEALKNKRKTHDGDIDGWAQLVLDPEDREVS
jgi:two-component system, sensor histidine kinase LadS